MNASESFQALRRANPRTDESFARSVEAAGDAVRARIASGAPRVRPRPRRRFVAASVGVSSVAAAVLAVLLTIGWPGGAPGVENAIAAVRKAVAVTAASAERSGTAVVRITHNGELWAGSTLRWEGGDLSVSQDAPNRQGKVGSELLLVDGTLYGEEEGWVNMGSPESIDPDSGTTPDDYLAAVREDVGGATLSRIVAGVTGLTTRALEDGSTVYSGAVPAGLIARESGFKEGQAIRVLPFGYVAHDEAADPGAPLDVAVTVGADGIVRQIAVAWGTWTYTVAYSGLGTTPGPVAPANARPLRDRSSAGGP